MSGRVTDGNPTGVRPFDHRQVAGRPEYAALSRALDAFAHAFGDSGTDPDITQEEFLEMVADMAAAVPYSDTCGACDFDRTVPPSRVEIDADDWLTGTYRCPRCGRSWTCGWAVNLPDVS